MMSLLRFTILVVFGVVTSQNDDANSQINIQVIEKNVEATTPIPADPKIENEGIGLILTRLETLCVENLEYLLIDTDRRFQSLENKSLEVQSSVNNIGDELSRISYPLNRLEIFLVEKLDNLTTEVGRLSQCCSVPAISVVQNIENLEAKVENMDKNIQKLMDATRNFPSNVEAISQNVSFLINVTRSLGNLSSTSELQQVFNVGLEEIKDQKTATSTSSPLNFTPDKQYPRNCREVGEFEKTASGNYIIQPKHALKPFEVVCDFETRGGGWTVIQKRFDGSQDFYLGWEEYKNGFGNLTGEFWLGLENIHFLTGFEANELLVELGDFESKNKSAFYSEFSVGSEIEGYLLKNLGVYSGDAQDALTYNFGKKFSTKDNNQDDYRRSNNVQPNCAEYYSSAWWFYNCSQSNLNGLYFDRENQVCEMRPVEKIFWKSPKEIFKHTRMLVRPKV